MILQIAMKHVYVLSGRDCRWAHKEHIFQTKNGENFGKSHAPGSVQLIGFENLCSINLRLECNRKGLPSNVGSLWKGLWAAKLWSCVSHSSRRLASRVRRTTCSARAGHTASSQQISRPVKFCCSRPIVFDLALWNFWNGRRWVLQCCSFRLVRIQSKMLSMFQHVPTWDMGDMGNQNGKSNIGTSSCGHWGATRKKRSAPLADQGPFCRTFPRSRPSSCPPRCCTYSKNVKKIQENVTCCVSFHYLLVPKNNDCLSRLKPLNYPSNLERSQTCCVNQESFTRAV